MKTNLIHTMAIVVLVTSISAFAQTGDTRREAPTTTIWKTAQQNDSNQEASDPVESNVSMNLDHLRDRVQQLEAKDKKNQEEEQKTRQERKKQLRQDEKEWEHSLLGIYGG
jgi:peptidoglycan hydrolase CwlO-like protein